MLSDVRELLLGDARLLEMKLQAQGRIVSSRGCGQGSSADLQQTRKLVYALADSSVQHVQQKQVPSIQASSHGAAVLGVVVQHWQQLMQERLNAAQMLLPDIPLVSEASTPQQVQELQATGYDDSEVWRQIGHKHSPWVLGLDAAPACTKLMYAAEDLLQSLTATVAVDPCRDPGCAHCCTSSNCSAGTRSSASSQPSEPQQQGEQQEQQQQVQLSLLRAVHAPNRAWLQSFFAELQPDRRQVGLDDVLHSWYRDQQVQQAHSIAASCSAAACRAAARTGVPASERPWVWATALGLAACPPTGPGSGRDSSDRQLHAAASAEANNVWWHLPNARHEERLQLLCNAVKQQGLLMDVLTCADVLQTADNAHFFVFEEAMRAVLLAFSRDASVMQQAAVKPDPVLTAGAPPGPKKPLRAYPPSGVLPFQGLSAYLAPLCYLYGSPAAMYPVWHAMYCQYWCRLHSLDSNPAPAAGLPVLCRTFLDLLQEVDIEVYRHLGSLTATPLDMVFSWLGSAFASHLVPAETLLLWDRIIGFDSLLPLPVLAVAVLTFRRDLVLAAETSEEVAELLQDLGQLRVVPLLQALLFDA